MQLWQLDVTASAFLASGTEVKIVTGIERIDISHSSGISRDTHVPARLA
jgi:hypothetical protein